MYNRIALLNFVTHSDPHPLTIAAPEVYWNEVNLIGWIDAE